MLLKHSLHVRKENVPEFTNNMENPLYDIRKASGAVLRLRDKQVGIQSNDDDDNDEIQWNDDEDKQIKKEDDERRELWVIGNPDQLNTAFIKLDQHLGDSQGYNLHIEESLPYSSSRLIWHGYKRNYKGQFIPVRQRRKCRQDGMRGNPCPLCQLSIATKTTNINSN